MKKIILGISFVLLGFGLVWSDGNSSVYDLYSPSFLGGGWSYTSEESPQADGINPAASARNQRITVDLSYVGLGFDDTLPGWDGILLNTGLTLPTKAGVLSFSGNFRHSPAWETLNLGTQFDLKTSFAKELYDDYLAGFGLNASLGNGYAVTADLGVIRHVGDWKKLKDLRWALVLQELGYNDKSADYPEPFSLGAGAAFTPVKTDSFILDLHSDINFPMFQNARLIFGADFSFKERIGLKVATRLDIKELIDGDSSGLIPSVGIYFNYKTSLKSEKLSQGMAAQQGWNQSDINIHAAAAPMGNGLWAIGGGFNIPLGIIDKKAPQIELELGGFRYSPDKEEESVPEESGESNETSFLDDNGGDKRSAKTGNNDKEVVLTGKSTSKNTSLTVIRKGEKKDTGRRVLLTQNSSGSSTKGLVKDPNEAESVPVVDYISPNNDGVYDDIEFPVKITDTRFIQGFALVIQDNEGNIVRKLENKEQRPENAGFTGFFKRLFSVKKGLVIPETVRWDGNSETGTVVPDGKYIFYLEAWDDNENHGYSQPLAVVVDNTPPELIMNPPVGLDLIFSPDGDGNKDDLLLDLSGSREDLWNMEILNSSGTVVKTREWRNEKIGSFVWDGKTNDGFIAPDDVYHVQIKSTDRAGNTTTGRMENIIINTIPTPVGITISNSYFSPGNSEAFSAVKFSLNIPVKTGILSWVLEVKGQNRVYKTFTGDEPPESLVFDGISDQNTPIPEGSYMAYLGVEYVNGSKPQAVSPEFIADTTRPTANVTASYPSFSPNGDDQKDTIKFYQETSQEEMWMGTILDSRENVVSTFTWREKADGVLEWTGHGDNGKLAEDGEYTYVLSAADKAGNVGTSSPVRFELDTEETSVLLSTGFDAFSPNGDKIKDIIPLIPELRVPQGINKYTFKIEDESNQVIREFSGTGNLNREFSWDGFTQEGRKADDATYRARLEVIYDKGDVSQATSRWFILDTTYPDIDLSLEYDLFSPDGDGNRDEVPVKQATSTETLWMGTIKNARGETVREYFWKENAGNFQWNGKDGDGNALSDGKYVYSLTAEDRAGNKSVSAPLEFTVDTTPRVVYVTAERDGFSPNGNGKFEDILFNVLIPAKTGISEWSLTISNAAGTDVKTFSAPVVPEKIIWDGKNDRGSLAADGRYTARLDVRYLKGNTPNSVTPSFILDTKAPDMSISMKPLPFSPDNDGVDDDLIISPKITDMTGIESWTLTITDRINAPFKVYRGSGEPAGEIRWDGRGDSGDVVISAEDYNYRFTAVDKWGNVSEKRGVIPVDVLVIREGNRLKIQIASIQFAPDSPSLSEASQEIIDRNIYVLRRVSEILKKYESYGITIEGHAASVYWNNAARAQKEEIEELQPLSKQRADTVKDFLVQLGINASRIQTLGRGGTMPTVPHSDIDNRWKNRRVEFLLDK